MDNVNGHRWNYHVPTFGSWDYGNENLEYSQCFENARPIGSLVRYGSYNTQVEDTDLYVAGDLYRNEVVTPTVIVVPRRPCRMRKGEYTNDKAEEKQEHDDMKKQEWDEYSYEIKVPSNPLYSPYKSKPIDQDLYQIPHEYFHVKPKRKRGFGLFSSCLQPACV